MGWRPVGRVPTAVRLASWAAPLRMARSRVPAERWSAPCSLGRDVREVLADPTVEKLLSTLPPARGLRTRRTRAYLRWRYGFEPLAYRALTASHITDGMAIFRLRRRGSAFECALCELLVPAGSRTTAGGCAVVRRRSGADYVIRIGGAIDRSGFVRLPRPGPLLTWRPLAGITRRRTRRLGPEPGRRRAVLSRAVCRHHRWHTRPHALRPHLR